MDNRLYRSTTDRVIGGVAGGLAAWMNVDPSLVRIAWVLLAIFSGGIFVLVYFVMMLVVPVAPPGWTPPGRPGGPYPGGGPYSPGGAPYSPGGAYPGWQPPDSTSWQPTPPAPGEGQPTTGVPPSTGDAAPAAGTTPPPGEAPPGPGSVPPGYVPPASGHWGSQAGWGQERGGWQSAGSGWNRPRGNSNVGIVAGVVLVLLGIWFIVDRYLNLNWSLLWPVIVILIGVALVAGAATRGRPPRS